MKKLSALLLCGIFIFGLVACSSSNNPEILTPESEVSMGLDDSESEQESSTNTQSSILTEIIGRSGNKDYTSNDRRAKSIHYTERYSFGKCTVWEPSPRTNL